MGICCGNNYIDPEIEECQNINDLKILLEGREIPLTKEKENYDNNLNNNIIDVNRKLDEVNNVLKEYQRIIDLLVKYERKINVVKVKKFIYSICNFANEKDYASMKYIIDKLEEYCISHY